MGAVATPRHCRQIVDVDDGRATASRENINSSDMFVELSWIDAVRCEMMFLKPMRRSIGGETWRRLSWRMDDKVVGDGELHACHFIHFERISLRFMVYTCIWLE